MRLLQIGVRMLSKTVRADTRKATPAIQLGKIAKASPVVAIADYPFFDPQHRSNTRDRRHTERVRRAQWLNLALSRRKQGFESPRERQLFQRLRR
jgi:hypothetical protein